MPQRPQQQLPQQQQLLPYNNNGHNNYFHNHNNNNNNGHNNCNKRNLPKIRWQAKNHWKNRRQVIVRWLINLCCFTIQSFIIKERVRARAGTYERKIIRKRERGEVLNRTSRRLSGSLSHSHAQAKKGRLEKWQLWRNQLRPKKEKEKNEKEWKWNGGGCCYDSGQRWLSRYKCKGGWLL